MSLSRVARRIVLRGARFVHFPHLCYFAGRVEGLRAVPHPALLFSNRKNNGLLML